MPFPSQDPIILHSTASHGSAYLFRLIDAAIWLLSQKRKFISDQEKCAEVKIILHPVRGALTPRAIAGRIKLQIKNWLGHHFIFHRSTFLAPDKNAPDKEILSVYERVYVAQEKVSLETSLGNITIDLAQRHLGHNLLSWVQCYCQAVLIWFRFRIDRELGPKYLLSLKYKDLVIGDLICSTALRWNPRAGGSIKACPNLISILVNALCICNYIWNDINDSFFTSYVASPEPTYLHSLYKRILHSRGAKVLELHHYDTEFKILYPSEPLLNPQVAYPPTSEQLSFIQKKRAKIYLHERIYEPQKHLWYMTNGHNSLDNKLFNIEGKVIEIKSKKLYAAVFLHSFDDAQYYYGVDDFNDIYDWTTFTIDHLLINPNIHKIFIKEHPNTDYSFCSGDKVAFEKLKIHYANISKLDWLQKNCGPIALSQLSHFVAITHHGSIAEELTYVGIPTIASVYAPWGDTYTFAQTWQSRDEYRYLLHNLSIDSWTQPTGTNLESLYKFIAEYRLSEFPEYRRATWLKYANFLGDEVPKINLERYEYYSRKLDLLFSKDPKLEKFLNTLALSRF